MWVWRRRVDDMSDKEFLKKLKKIKRDKYGKLNCITSEYLGEKGEII